DDQGHGVASSFFRTDPIGRRSGVVGTALFQPASGCVRRGGPESTADGLAADRDLRVEGGGTAPLPKSNPPFSATKPINHLGRHRNDKNEEFYRAAGLNISGSGSPVTLTSVKSVRVSNP